MNPDRPEQKRVLHVIDGFGGGGAETWLLAAAQYIQANPALNLRFDFLATGGQPRLYDEEIKAQGCRIFYVKYSYRNFFSFRKQLKIILKENKYCAIHDHQDFVSGWHFLLGSGYLPPVRIMHLHNPYNFVHNYVNSPLRWISFKLGRLLGLFLATTITGTSDAVMDEYGYNRWPYKRKRVAPAYCGFDVSKFVFNPGAKKVLYDELGWETSAKTALFVGRIGLHDYDTAENQKNPGFAFSVAKALIHSYPDWNFIFAGFKGRVGEAMETETRESGLQYRIKFLGLRNDIPAIMSAADLLLFPSLWEGLGMVVVESQAAGLPVLSSDSVPSEAIVISEMVLRKKLADGVASWANAIPGLLHDSVAHKQHCNAMVNGSAFSIEHSVLYLDKLYNKGL